MPDIVRITDIIEFNMKEPQETWRCK